MIGIIFFLIFSDLEGGGKILEVSKGIHESYLFEDGRLKEREEWTKLFIGDREVNFKLHIEKC